MGCKVNQYDPRYLEDMSGGDEEFVRDIISTFLDTAHNLVSGLQSAADAMDRDKAIYLSHTLKGSARSVGAGPLGDLCEELEKLARGEDMAGYSVLVAKVPETFALLTRELNVVLQPRAA